MMPYGTQPPFSMGPRSAPTPVKRYVAPEEYKWTTPKCVMCGQTSIIMLTNKEYQGWYKHDTPLHVAFEHRNAEEIELIMTGMHLACWDEMYGE